MAALKLTTIVDDHILLLKKIFEIFLSSTFYLLFLIYLVSNDNFFSWEYLILDKIYQLYFLHSYDSWST